MAAIPSVDEHVAQRLVEEHHGRVFAFCLQQMRNRDDAADATQTTFLHALGALQRGVVPSLEGPWLIAIARNVCRTRWDAGARRARVETVHDPHRLAELAAATEPTHALEGVAEALAELPEQQRRAVLLRDWQGLSYQEVADELGVTVANAETLIFRGRKKLARTLGEERFGIGPLLGWAKSAWFGGGVVVKVAVGATFVAGVGVAVATTPAAGGHSRSAESTLVRPVRTAPAKVAAAPSSPVPRKRVSRTRLHPVPKRVLRVSAAVRTPTNKAAPPTPSPEAPTPAAAIPTAAPSDNPPATTSTVPTPPAQPPPPVADPAGQVVTAVTEPVTDVVTTVTTTVDPVVTPVTTAVQPVVTQVTGALPTVPLTPPPVHLP